MGSISLGDNVASIPRRFWLDLLVHRPQISLKLGHDRASIVILDLGRPPSDLVGAIPREKLHDRGSIAPRSVFDRAAIGVRSRRDRGLIAPRSRFDRTVIAVRSDRNRGFLPRNVCTVRWSVKRVDGPIAIKRYPNLMTIRRFSCRHVASGKRSDHVHLKWY